MFSSIFSLLLMPLFAQGGPIVSPLSEFLAVREFSMDKRYDDMFVNGVFKDNILLTVRYLTGEKIDPAKIDWKEIEKPFSYKLILKPGETFAFHDDVLPTYEGKIAKTTNAHFNSQEGFKSSGFLVGDGVCQLASLLYWAARDAGLETLRRVNHDFRAIPDVPREYGVSIYAYPGKQYSDQLQNLYITNNKERDIAFEFHYDGQHLRISVLESMRLAAR